MNHDKWVNEKNASQEQEDGKNGFFLSETEKDNGQSKKSIKDTSNSGTDDDSNGISTMYWLPIGIALGVAIGISTNQMSLWLSLGIAAGILLSLASKKNGLK